MSTDTIETYHASLAEDERRICDTLRARIDHLLAGAESKIWHGHPVWFLDGNPVVGYSRQKAGIRLMFWSGADFDEPALTPGTGKFRDASVFYTDASQVTEKDLDRWLDKARTIQWDYKNVVRRKGKLVRIEPGG